ncbi:hypothetical protein [Pseudoxanthomonas suwonensis]|jgi:hypothetical protein|uniref:hypothetical protein n=1 Tax=Pseudoxanthomonas suwonensis TaxID=314722 RepID=UPI00138F8B3B|nr:hypothetical protein [Pseudoxanthomonas suwonensis]
MKPKHLLVPLALAACMTSGNALAQTKREIIYCTENTCLVRDCVTIPGAGTQCGIGLVPRLSIRFGPGYPKEP